MVYPKNLVLVRHGQSEGNIVHKGLVTPPEGFLRSADVKRRLTNQGRTEAEVTGKWLRTQNYTFSRYYVSPYIRTLETAVHLNLSDQWIIDDLWRERDWGEYGLYSKEEQQQYFKDSNSIKNAFAWYWKPAGGESLSTGVRSRVNSILTHLSRMDGAEAVLGVCHGEFISTFQFVIERMTPHEWVERESNSYYSIRNGSVVEYTRVDPNNPENVKNFYHWGRVYNPNNPALSQNNGEWYKIPRKTYTMKEMEEIINTSEPWF